MMYKVKGVDDNKWPVVRLLVVTIHSGRRSMVRHCRGICGCSKSCWMALKVEIASVQEPDYVGPWGREKDAARPPFFFFNLDAFGKLSSSTNQADVFWIKRRFWFHMGCTGFKSGDVWIFLDFFVVSTRCTQWTFSGVEPVEHLKSLDFYSNSGWPLQANFHQHQSLPGLCWSAGARACELMDWANVWGTKTDSKNTAWI